MTTLPQMGLVIPTQGAAGAGEWDDVLDDNLALIDSHRHVTGEGTAIPTAGININADLTFSSLYAPINLHRITFASIVALTSNNKSLFVSSADNELYWRSNSGSNVKLTSGSALNVAAFTGGFGGDYAAVSALADYDDATDTYRFRQELNASVRQFAKVKFADISLVEYDPAGDASVPANSVTIKSPDALAANYSVTMPAAVPGSTSIVQMDSSGVLTASNTVANAVSLGSTLGVTGAATLTGGIANNVTLTSGATAAADQHVVVSGTGRHKHGTRELNVAISAYAVDGASTYVTFNQAGYITGFGGACSCQAWVPLEVGKRILTYKQFYDVGGAGSILPRLLRINLVTGTVTTGFCDGVSDNTGTGIESQTVSPSHTILSGEAYYIQVNVTNAANRVYGATITYDEP